MYVNMREATLAHLKAIVDNDAAKEVTVRGMKTHEFMHKSFTIYNPKQRFPFLTGRNSNPFAQIAETLWVLAGRNDLDWLETYIPQCKKWSDDGVTWRAAYGPRLREWDTYDGMDHVPGSTDQIAEVVNKLKADPETRQAVISIWDPAQDWVEGSKDYPCNNWLHFMIRNNKLHLSVAVRSNDIIYGFSHVDFFCWSVLQEMIAAWVGVEVGHMQWNASSFHLYDSQLDKATEIAHNNQLMYNPYDVLNTVGMDMWPDVSEFDDLLSRMFSKPFAADGAWPSPEFFWWSQYMLGFYNFYKDNDSQDMSMKERVEWVKHLANMVSDLPHLLDMKIAAIDYFARHIPGFTGALHLHVDEYKVLRQLDIA